MVEYIRTHYENVTIIIKDNWMKLDFYRNMTKEEIKSTIVGLYDFMRNYDYFEKLSEIKSSIYEEAIKYMKNDLEKDKHGKHSKSDDDTQTDQLDEDF